MTADTPDTTNTLTPWVLLHGFWAIPRSRQKWVERYEGRAHRRLTDPLYARECVEGAFSETGRPREGCPKVSSVACGYHMAWYSEREAVMQTVLVAGATGILGREV